MPLRLTITEEELRAKLTPEQLQQQATTYSASRGGHYPAQTKPVPGQPKQ